MSEIQVPENNSADPRWTVLRVSRINLGLCLAGALLAFPVMWVLSDVPGWMRLALLAGLVLSMAWDVWLILLKGRDSVGAFYLFDLDPPAVAEAPAGRRKAAKPAPRLGIRVRFANAGRHPGGAEREGIVLQGAFVSPWFTALRFQLPGEGAWRRAWPRVIPLWKDSLDAAEFRKIRVALKWK